MEKTAPPDSLVVCGDLLKQARELRGMTVPEMAGEITLSREQVRALEDGGNLPFYTAAHKRLALKKYAAAFGIPLSDLIVDTTESDRPQEAAGIAGAPATPADAGTPAGLRLAAAERTVKTRHRLLVAAVLAAALLALYAKQRGTSDTDPPSASAEIETAPAQDPDAPIAGTADTGSLPEMTAATATPNSSPLATAGASDAVTCTLPPVADAVTWSPPYQRKQEARLFLVSSKAIDVCIADAAGRPSLISLKPNAGQSFSGKPPYFVAADGLASVAIYLQGMRVRIPADARALRLLPTTIPRPAEIASSPAAE